MNRQSAKFIKDFIQRYRSLPCLWKMKSRDYFNKIKKADAYEKLAGVCKKYYPAADVTFVKQKIQTIRTVYKKELNKVEVSKRSGGDEIYVPRLWYYELLSFINDQEVTKPSQRLMSKKQPQVKVLQECSEPTEDSQVSAHGGTSEETERSDEFTAADSSPAATWKRQIGNHHGSLVFPHTSAVRSRKRNRVVGDKTNELLEQAKRLLSNGPDEYEGIGINVAGKMRRMEERQRIYCEKLLTDLLTKGLLGELDENTMIGSRGHVLPPQTPFNQHHMF